jgi:hypothetical protein
MLSDREKEAARLGMAALDAALVDLGCPPLGENPHVRMVDPVVLDIPNAVVEKPGCAPMLFVFAPHLDVWIGPFSELLNLDVLEDTQEHVQHLIRRVLRSEVTFRKRWRSVEIVLRVPDSEPWLQLTSFGGVSGLRLEPSYAPYARQSVCDG